MKCEHMIRLAAMLMVAGGNVYAEDESKRIIVSIPDRKLLLMRGTRVLKIYDVAVGKPATPSPHGVFHIANRIPNPTWYGPGQVVAPGKSNPLGTRWMGLGAGGYGIHGTNAPKSIGKAASHGCIRMKQRDLEELFDLVKIGTTVELHGERPPEVAMLFVLAEVIAA
jgi:lipoprotein-anchoring transpeptidase ErfK/SrfK